MKKLTHSSVDRFAELSFSNDMLINLKKGSKLEFTRYDSWRITVFLLDLAIFLLAILEGLSLFFFFG